jgi:hypothetical protein
VYNSHHEFPLPECLYDFVPRAVADCPVKYHNMLALVQYPRIFQAVMHRCKTKVQALGATVVVALEKAVPFAAGLGLRVAYVSLARKDSAAGAASRSTTPGLQQNVIEEGATFDTGAGIWMTNGVVLPSDVVVILEDVSLTKRTRLSLQRLLLQSVGESAAASLTVHCLSLVELDAKGDATAGILLDDVSV